MEFPSLRKHYRYIHGVSHTFSNWTLWYSGALEKTNRYNNVGRVQRQKAAPTTLGRIHHNGGTNQWQNSTSVSGKCQTGAIA